MAAHTSQFDTGAHTQYYPGCPAEGQSLQRGQVWNMPVFSLMTHSTINTLQLSRSVWGYGGVYWLLALVALRTLSCTADLPDWSWRRSSLTHVQYSGAQQPHRRTLTHSSTEGPMRHQKSDAQVLFSSSCNAQWRALFHFPHFPRKVCMKSIFYLPWIVPAKMKRCEDLKDMQTDIVFPHDNMYSTDPPDAFRVTAGSCRSQLTGQH